MHACVWVCAWYVRVCDHAWGLEVRGDFSVVAGVWLVVVRRGGGCSCFCILILGFLWWFLGKYALCTHFRVCVWGRGCTVDGPNCDISAWLWDMNNI